MLELLYLTGVGLGLLGIIQRLGYLLDFLKQHNSAAVLHQHLQKWKPLPWIDLMCESAARAGPFSPPLIATVSAPAPAARSMPRRVKSIVRSEDNGRDAVRSHIVILLAESLPAESNVRATL